MPSGRWSIVAGLGLGGLAAAGGIVRRRREYLAQRMRNTQLNVLVVSLETLGLAYATVLADSGVYVDLVVGDGYRADLERRELWVRGLVGARPVVTPARFLARPDVTREYDLALVVAPATALDVTLFRVRQVVDATPLLVITRSLLVDAPHAGGLGDQPLLMGIPGFSALSTWQSSAHGKGRLRATVLGESDGSRSQGLCLATRLLARAGLEVSIDTDIHRSQRQSTAFEVVRAAHLQARRHIASSKHRGEGHSAWRALALQETRHVLEAHGLPLAPAAAITARHLARCWPLGTAELRMLYGQLMTLANQARVSTPTLAQLGPYLQE